MHWIDPQSLPEITGSFERFLLNPHGDADGMILADGTEVHFPPHLGDEIQAALDKDRKGLLRIRGVRPREGDVFAAVAIEIPGGGTIVDNGPPKKHEESGEPHKQEHRLKKREPMKVEGVVRRALHGPKGEVRGALLEDGHIIRFTPHEGPRLKELLSRGHTFAARGDGLTTRLGTVIEAHEIGADVQSLRPVGKHDKPEKKPKPPHHEDKHHGPEAA
jgi:hypothetical protein